MLFSSSHSIDLPIKPMNSVVPHSDHPTSPATAESSSVASTPRLSHRNLTLSLIAMCIVPLVTLTVLWKILPPTEEGVLEAHVTSAGLPPDEFYLTKYYERDPFSGGELIVTNTSDQDWTHLDIRINGSYQIYDIKPIPAGATTQFRLDRFITRTGARFSLRYNQLKSVRIYARRPTRDRATFYHEFETAPEK
jgi:hypothetical protein